MGGCGRTERGDHDASAHGNPAQDAADHEDLEAAVARRGGHGRGACDACGAREGDRAAAAEPRVGQRAADDAPDRRDQVQRADQSLDLSVREIQVALHDALGPAHDADVVAEQHRDV